MAAKPSKGSNFQYRPDTRVFRSYYGVLENIITENSAPFRDREMQSELHYELLSW